ncbi:hypothetical protein N7517_008396 [Penicillium concentricum]|uniref:Uncharacterized protein n=1 Tax=Penicillium concentricum TaxID=293559 RepID=A0A9W9RSC8_9EURO|nr:uncharacterized protein N7517_008396 [Penicillium concentricum]KAJ5365510.1 hypothetical protein N7517_008396 [Penicillium concentricum]
MISGFDIPQRELVSLFTPEQVLTIETFEGLAARQSEMNVVTRTRRSEVEDNWHVMTSMPWPTMPPYPLYACRYNKRNILFTSMNEIPPISNRTITPHHRRRGFGWPSMKGDSYTEKHEVVFFASNPLLVFHNEREYEAIRMIGLLREAEAEKKTYESTFNRDYEFDLFPPALVHDSQHACLDQFHYGILDARITLHASDEAQEFGNRECLSQNLERLSLSPHKGAQPEDNSPLRLTGTGPGKAALSLLRGFRPLS